MSNARTWIISGALGLLGVGGVGVLASAVTEPPAPQELPGVVIDQPSAEPATTKAPQVDSTVSAPSPVSAQSPVSPDSPNSPNSPASAESPKSPVLKRPGPGGGRDS